jgi:alpha-L-rhamnosidase
VSLRFAEILLGDGAVDQSNLRSARAADFYTLRGDAAGETWEPRFTYHGFRYVQVSGYPGEARADDLIGIVVHSDLAETGALALDNPLLQQLWRNTLWSQRSNFVGIPTDCPQRDERLGWMGDANVFWDAAAFGMDVAAFTRRYLGDVRDAQNPEGAYPDFAPVAFPLGGKGASPGWADAGVTLPWTVWQRYGDTGVIDENWVAMTRYLAYIERHNPDHVWRNLRGNDFADWLALDAKQPGDPTTPKDLVGTATWAHSVDCMTQMAEATGRGDEAAACRALKARIAAAFEAAFVAADGTVGNGSQTGYILALRYGLVPEPLRAAAADKLVADIRRRGTLLSTGFLGTPNSLDVLADAGQASLVYDLLLRTEYPSWGYMIAKGATTIWERWNGDTGDIAMNSYNHYALGAICGFLFRRVAGIAPAAAGFRRIVFQPVLDARLPRGGGDYDSALGRISSRWERQDGGGFRLALSVPANATATVHLPAAGGRSLREGRQALTAKTAGVLALQRTADEAIVEVGSGDYVFTVR